jgi:hypothetical protein
MKKIIRLTESDLTRIVRRVIKEQESGIASATVKPLGGNDPNVGLAKTIVGKLMTASGGMGTDEEGIHNAVLMIKDKPTYWAVIKVLQTSPKVKAQFGKNFNKVIDLVDTEISDRADYNDAYHKSDVKWFTTIKAHLEKFSDSERFTSGPGGGRNREWES